MATVDATAGTALVVDSTGAALSSGLDALMATRVAMELAETVGHVDLARVLVWPVPCSPAQRRYALVGREPALGLPLPPSLYSTSRMLIVGSSKTRLPSLQQVLSASHVVPSSLQVTVGGSLTPPVHTICEILVPWPPSTRRPLPSLWKTAQVPPLLLDLILSHQ